MKRAKLGVDDFEPLKVIGKGAFGEVRLVQKVLAFIQIVLLFVIYIRHVYSPDIDKSLDLEKFSKRNDSDFSLSLARS